VLFEKKDFKYANELIKELIDKLIPSEKHDYYKLSAGWREIVGMDIALNVFPRDIEKKTLILEANHPGWHQEVLMRKKGILKRIRKKYSELEIREIEVFIGGGRRDST